MSQISDKFRLLQIDLRAFFTAQLIAAFTLLLLKFTSLSIVPCVLLAFAIVFFVDLPFFVAIGLSWLGSYLRDKISLTYRLLTRTDLE
jgi:hypothetical protein